MSIASKIAECLAKGFYYSITDKNTRRLLTREFNVINNTINSTLNRNKIKNLVYEYRKHQIVSNRKAREKYGLEKDDSYILILTKIIKKVKEDVDGESVFKGLSENNLEVYLNFAFLHKMFLTDEEKNVEYFYNKTLLQKIGDSIKA
ncbi:unnamed protein product [marine sediment metagenome]|uniref:Uncharacterized protein n=1 Tax=marine sediment metagenome TaxID=412755 RepID=X1FSD4_9ZZZZ